MNTAGGKITLSSHVRGVLYIVITAVLWGTTGAFSQHLGRLGLEPTLIGAGRVSVAMVAGIVLFLLAAARENSGKNSADTAFASDLPDSGAESGARVAAGVQQRVLSWRIEREDLPLLLLNGLFGVSVFHFSYLATIEQVGMGLAAVLMYIKPAIVLLLAFYLLQEHISRLKLFSLGLTFTGILLVINLPSLWLTGAISVTVGGIATGLLAGFAGALFATLNKVLMRKHHPLKVNVYNLIFGSIGLWLFVCLKAIVQGNAVEQAGRLATGPLVAVLTPLQQSDALFWLIAMGIVTTFLPYLFYILGLQWIGAGQANMIAGIEPVVAMVVGIAFFSERLVIWQWVGSILVIVAATLVSRPENLPPYPGKDRTLKPKSVPTSTSLTS